MLRVEYRLTKRGKTFTDHEKLHLYQCIVPYLDIIVSKSMDSFTFVRKAEAWKQVTEKFNASPAVCKVKLCFRRFRMDGCVQVCEVRLCVPDSAGGAGAQRLELSGCSAPDRTDVLSPAWRGAARRGWASKAARPSSCQLRG